MFGSYLRKYSFQGKTNYAIGFYVEKSIMPRLHHFDGLHNNENSKLTQFQSLYFIRFQHSKPLIGTPFIKSSMSIAKAFTISDKTKYYILINKSINGFSLSFKENKKTNLQLGIKKKFAWNNTLKFGYI